jgi:hypothetical protein
LQMPMSHSLSEIQSLFTTSFLRDTIPLATSYFRDRISSLSSNPHLSYLSSNSHLPLHMSEI